MADLDAAATPGGDAQAVKGGVSVWWILGAIFVVIAVVLGVRSVRKARKKKEAGGGDEGAANPGGALPNADDPA